MLSRRDAYETFSANGREGRRRRKGGRRWRIVAPLLLVCAVVAALVVGDYWMNYGKIYRGVEVAGIALGDKTPEEAQQILEERTGGLEEIELTGPEDFTLSSDRLGLYFDAQTTVERAYAVGREGGILKRIYERVQATRGTVHVPLAIDYERERLRNGLSGVTEEPELTSAEAESLKPTTLLGKYRTDYRETSDKSRERVENLEIASNAIDGTFLAPEEVFSLSELAAPLSYNETKVIIEGKEEKGDGGGLCQVSSTLYMAANYAGLEMVERHPHAAQLPYIRPGLDATVW